jgi:hypothetical protein
MLSRATHQSTATPMNGLDTSEKIDRETLLEAPVSVAEAFCLVNRRQHEISVSIPQALVSP